MPVARIYLRNSSDKQAKAATINAQRPDCRALAARVAPGLPVVEYADEGVSGDAPLAERRALHQLLAAVEPGDCVIGFAQDRLSRSDDMIEHAAVFGIFQRRGVVVHTCQEGAIDVRDQVGRLRAQLQSDAAAAEKRKIAARTAAGKRTAAAEGRKPQGATPYGLAYDRVTRKWSEHPVHAPLERELFARALGGETTGQLAADFKARAAAHPRGPAWSSARVWRILTRTAARGEWTFEGRTIQVPAVIDDATWHAVQAQLLAAGRRGLRRTQHVYLLDDGLGRCGYCSGPLHVRWGGRDNRVSYYHCPQLDCVGGWRRTEQVDFEVWERLRTALQREDLVSRALSGEREASADAATGDEDAAGFERRIAKLDEVEAAVLARFRRGLVSESGMDGELTRIARERALLVTSAAAAREAAQRARTSVTSLQGLQEAARALAGELGRVEGAERREVVRGLRLAVELRREALDVRFRLVAGVSCAMVGCSSSCTERQGDTPASDVVQGILVVA